MESKRCQIDQERTEKTAAWDGEGSSVLRRRALEKLWAELMQNKTKQNKWDMEKSAMFYV